jgi:hypothetical protein
MFELFNNTTSVLNVLGNGYVGFGIVPAAKLHLYQPTAFAACTIRTQINSLGDYWEAGSAYAATSHQYQLSMSGTAKLAVDTHGVSIGTYAGTAIVNEGGLVLPGNLGIGINNPAGKLDVYTVKTTPPYSVSFSQQDLTHGITTRAPTGSFGIIQSTNTSGHAEGGLLIRGISNSLEASGNVICGLTLEGILGNDATEGHASAILMRGSMGDGTGVTDIDHDYGIVFSLYNNNTALIDIWGSGYTRFTGQVAIDHIINATSMHPVTFDYDVTINSSYYCTAKYKSSDGTAGVSGSGSTITCKNGIITAIS